MMQDSKVILFSHEGNLAVIYPVLSCGLSIKEIAKKDVPFGEPFKIVDADSDYAEEKFAEPDGVGADYGSGSDWYASALLNGCVSRITHSKTKETREFK